MTDMFFQPDDAATSLTRDEKNGLLPTYITTRGELNEAEQSNIIKAQRWAFNRRREVLDEDFLCELHRRMFNEVWAWAGTFRLTARNIGIEAYRIGPELRMLINDVRYQIDHHTYTCDEIIARFHHRLVSIHPFPNGNGRHSRLAADLLAVQLNQPLFDWGDGDLSGSGNVRHRYVAALRAADNHELAPLLTFMRSGCEITQ